jgi:hypothetical protein
MSTGKEPAQPPVAAAKPRSPVERAVVWGGILILLILVGIEFNWKRSHETAMNSLLEKVKQEETTEQSVKAADVKAIVGGKVPRVESVVGKRLASNAARVEIYSWPTLNVLSKRELYVYYGVGEGDDADVLGVTTSADNDTVEKVWQAPSKEEAAELMKKAYVRPQKESSAGAVGADQPADKETADTPGDEKPAGEAPVEKSEK